jgi:hypothetical protein
VLRGSRSAPAARRLPRAALVIGAVVGTVALGGCGAGQVAQTAFQANASGGMTVNANGLAIRDAQIAFGETPEGAAVHRVGSNAPVEMYVINESPQNDRLLSASSPIATSVQISGATDLPAGVAMVVGGQSSTGGQNEPGAPNPDPDSPLDAGLPPVASEPTAAPSSSPQEPSNSSPTGAASPSGEAPAVGLPQVPPAIAAIEPSTRYTQVVLTGLREEIRAGLKYEMDLTFERAGVVRVPLPVAYPPQPREEAEHSE